MDAPREADAVFPQLKSIFISWGEGSEEEAGLPVLVLRSDAGISIRSPAKLLRVSLLRWSPQSSEGGKNKLILISHHRALKAHIQCTLSAFTGRHC